MGCILVHLDRGHVFIAVWNNGKVRDTPHMGKLVVVQHAGKQDVSKLPKFREFRTGLLFPAGATKNEPDIKGLALRLFYHFHQEFWPLVSPECSDEYYDQPKLR